MNQSIINALRLSIVALMFVVSFKAQSKIGPKDVCECRITKEDTGYIITLNMLAAAKFEDQWVVDFALYEKGEVILHSNFFLFKKKGGGFSNSFMITEKLLLEAQMNVAFQYKSRNYAMIIKFSKGEDGKVVAKYEIEDVDEAS